VITGHFGVAGVVRSVSRAKMSSGIFIALVFASLAPDIADAVYSVLGICSPYGLYSHTLHAVVLEAAIVGGMAFLATGSRVTALTFAFVVLLHVPADYFTGRKLLLPGGEMVGLSWYDRPLYDYLLEVPTVLLGWWLLRRSGRAPRWATAVWMLVLVLIVQTAFDVVSAGTSRGVKSSACFRNGSRVTHPSNTPDAQGRVEYATAAISPTAWPAMRVIASWSSGTATLFTYTAPSSARSPHHALRRRTA